jgi:hypothetical protein
MKLFSLFLFPVAAGALVVSAGCGSSSSSSETSLSCVVQLDKVAAPMCQHYEASGPDAARTIRSLRSGCVNQSGFHARIVDSCPPEGNLGGCRRPVTVTGGADVQLDVTDFFYEAAADASALGSPATPAAVQRLCDSDRSVFVPAP